MYEQSIIMLYLLAILILILAILLIVRKYQQQRLIEPDINIDEREEIDFTEEETISHREIDIHTQQQSQLHDVSMIEQLIQQQNFTLAEKHINLQLKQNPQQIPLYEQLIQIYTTQHNDFAIQQLMDYLEQHQHAIFLHFTQKSVSQTPSHVQYIDLLLAEQYLNLGLHTQANALLQRISIEQLSLDGQLKLEQLKNFTKS